MLNLITNAIKYTHEGRIEVGYSVDGKNVEFYVKDTGLGIPAREQEKIFSRFAKIDREKKFNAPGLGIGLSICKGLTSSMGVMYGLNRKKTKGPVFIFQSHLLIVIFFFQNEATSVNVADMYCVIAFQVFPQFCYIHIHAAGCKIIVVAPQFLQRFFAG